MNRPGREFKKRQTTKNTKEICKRYGEGENFEKIWVNLIYHRETVDFGSSNVSPITSRKLPDAKKRKATGT